MIKIFLGQLGSGKSVSAVREMYEDDSKRKTYTNLITYGIKNAVHIQPQDIIKKITDEKGKVKFELNSEYWAKQKKPLNIIWDEIHLTANARSSMSKVNMVLSRFIAMARRITGFDERGYGHFIFIAQTERTIDVNIRELASEIRYHIGHYFLRCEDCNMYMNRSSEMPQLDKCPICNSWRILKEGLFIEVRKFKTWDDYFNFRLNIKGIWHFERYMISDIEKYFKMYDTLQMTDVWENYIND